jgi:hypothetical protein
MCAVYVNISVPYLSHAQLSHVHVHTKSCFGAYFYVTEYCEPLISLLVKTTEDIFYLDAELHHLSVFQQFEYWRFLSRS